DHGGEVDVGAVAQERDDGSDDEGEDARCVGAGVQGLGRVAALLAAHELGADDGGDDAAGRDQQGQRGQVRVDVLVDDGDGLCGYDGADVGLEEIGAHARHVAHVVTDVVGDDGRVAGIVLRNARLHLAHPVGADVRGLGVDAAADAGEQGDGG